MSFYSVDEFQSHFPHKRTSFQVFVRLGGDVNGIKWNSNSPIIPEKPTENLQRCFVFSEKNSVEGLVPFHFPAEQPVFLHK